jgi:GDP-L-fucose synthase
MRVLFTGQRGFLGRELIPILNPDFEIITYDGDLDNLLELSHFVKDRGIGCVLHAAARGGRRTKIDTESVLINNIKIANNILRLELPSIFFCSGAIYDRSKPVSEAIELSSLESFPKDFYGQSKYVATLLSSQAEYVNTLRFFNVFGTSEGLDRFISFNVNQYIKREPMEVYSDFQMDFFFVKDAVFPIRDWLDGKKIPKEMNLVYKEKYSLTEVCKEINRLSNYEVPIVYKTNDKGPDYTGSGVLLENYRYPLMGLKHGVEEVYSHFMSI